MRLAWLTDIHLNFLPDQTVAEFAGEVAAAEVDGILISGDIADAPTLGPALRDFAHRVGGPIYFVLGNHDYYHSTIAAVRQEVATLTAEVANLYYLPTCGVVELTRTTGLVGVGGWGDGRLGDFGRSRVLLNDYLLIHDLAHVTSTRLQERLGELGDAEAAALRPTLTQAARRFDQVVVLTHVPPFREACWHDGAISNDQWLPHFTCQAVGEILLEVAAAHPACRIRVRCGHTHGAGTADLSPNLRVVTGGAVYGRPVIQEILEVG